MKLLLILRGKWIERRLKKSNIDRMQPPKGLYNRIVKELKQRGTWKDDNPGD